MVTADSYKMSLLKQFTSMPFLSTMVGSSLILIGVIILLVSSLFLPRQEEAAAWTSFWGMIVVNMGGLMYAISTFINSAILISVGALFLTIGLMIFNIYLGWELRDIKMDVAVNHPEEFKRNTERRAEIGVAAMIIVMIGIAFFIRKALQRMVKPYLGAANYNLYGALTFGAGAIAYLLLNVKFIEGVDDDEFNPLTDTDRFGAFLFCTGALLLLLAIARPFYNMDLLMVPNFPSMTVLELAAVQGFGMQVLSSVLVIGTFLFVLGEVLTFYEDRYKMVTATCAVLCVCYAGIAMVLGASPSSRHTGSHRGNTEVARSSKVVLILGYAGLATGFFIYTIGSGLQLHLQRRDDHGRHAYAGDFRTAGMAVGLLNAVILALHNYSHTIPQYLCPGNYHFIANLLMIAGCFATFLAELTTSAGKDEDSCDIACEGSRELGYICIFWSNLMLFLYCVVLNDFVSVSKPSSWPSLCYEIVLDLSEGLWQLITLGHGNKLWQNEYVSVAKEGSSSEDSGHCDESKVDGQSDNKNQHNSEKSSNQEEVFGLPELYEEFAALEDQQHNDGNDESSNSIMDTDVFIVGCGPTGLTLANEVGLRGVRAVVVDMRTDVAPDSRFFNLSCATVEGLKRIGLLDNILSRSIPSDFGHGSVASTGLTQPDTRIIAAAHGPSRAEAQALGHRLSDAAASRVMCSRWAAQQTQRCMQMVQESCLKERAEEQDTIEVMYGWKLVSFYDDGNRVLVKIQNVQNGVFRYVKSQFLVGCDGPGSFVSRTLKTRFDGFVNLGQTRTVHFYAPGLLAKIQPKLGDALQYHVARPGYGVGWFVLNDLPSEAWTFFLVGLTDGRTPKQLSHEEMVEVLAEFIGHDMEFSVTSDAPWFWNLFFSRRFVFGRTLLAGDAAHSWAPFAGLGGNTCYADANNLGWKLAAIVKGWAPRKPMLDTYDVERREVGLRVIMAVLNFAPDRSQLMRLATIAKYPLTWWTIRFRWIFASAGNHSGNHMMSEGVSFGLRYASQLIYSNCAQQGVEPLYDTVSRYHPSIVAGGRIPHIQLLDKRSVNDLIALDGYTLLVLDPKLRVTDGLINVDDQEIEENEANIPSAGSDAARRLYFFFRQRTIPLTIVNMWPLLHEISAPEEEQLVKLYSAQHLILVRPDLHVSWFLNRAVNRTDTISILELQRVAQFACCEIFDEAYIEHTRTMTEWLTNRFISNIKGYSVLHPHALYVENEDKSSVITRLAAQKAQGIKGNSDEERFSSLLTKAAIDKDEKIELHENPQRKALESSP